MLVGDDHDMPRGVRVGVEDDEIMLSAMDDERLLVVAGVQQFAKNASRLLIDGGHVRIAPGSPDVVHW